MNRLGIITALPQEASCLKKGNYFLNTPVEIKKDIFVCMSGMGKENATLGAKVLLNHYGVNALISWGIAGGIHSKMHPGDLIIATEVFADKVKYTPTQRWLDKINTFLTMSNISVSIHRDRLVSTNTICATTIEKKHLLENTNACAVDMESLAIARFAQANKIEFIILRTIADDASTIIPSIVSKNTDKFGHLVAIPFTLSCLTEPGQVIELIKLARYYRKAIATLKKIAPDLKRQHFLYKD